MQTDNVSPSKHFSFEKQVEIVRVERSDEHSNAFVRQEEFYRERNEHRSVVLVQNPLLVAALFLLSFSDLSQDLYVVLLFCRLALRDTHSLLRISLIWNKNDVHDLFLMSQID
ncbi:hypothetical protein TNCV_624001 [Trichonephila clavipes]|nr:hypothetical protein TNCV_624001 [Trichonephila clavipes]